MHCLHTRAGEGKPRGSAAFDCCSSEKREEFEGNEEG